eukprot:COSAG06_NODE_42926_length_377_cov_0.618705_1_plen_43_part_10
MQIKCNTDKEAFSLSFRTAPCRVVYHRAEDGAVMASTRNLLHH